MNKIRISDHFNFRKILKFTLSPVLMMVFMSIYSVVDGFFISNYASKEAFAGVNLIFPVIMILAGIGFMFGTGGSAFVATLLDTLFYTLLNTMFDTFGKTVFACCLYCVDDITICVYAVLIKLQLRSRELGYFSLLEQP